MRSQPWWNCPKNMITDYKKLRNNIRMIQMILLFWRSTVISLKEYLSRGLYGEANGTDLQKPVYPAFVKTAGSKGESPYLCLPDGKSYGAKRFFSGRKNIENHGSELAQR